MDKFIKIKNTIINISELISAECRQNTAVAVEPYICCTFKSGDEIFLDADDENDAQAQISTICSALSIN